MSTLTSNIYQQIWETDIDRGEGVRAILVSVEGGETVGYVKIEEQNITNKGGSHDLLAEVIIPGSKCKTYILSNSHTLDGA